MPKFGDALLDRVTSGLAPLQIVLPDVEMVGADGRAFTVIDAGVDVIIGKQIPVISTLYW